MSFFHYVRVNGLVDEKCFPFDNENWDAECPELEGCEKYKMLDFCVLQKEENIKREIMNNGPVITLTMPYQDLLTYKSGVYH